MRVTVWFTPPPVPIRTAGAVVAVDVLRATSTLAVAMRNGAARVHPVATVEEARALKALRPEALLCGEREGLKLEGFDLGNSPFEYGREVVLGRELIFASTNGSRALLAGARAPRRRIAAFVNASAALRAVEGEETLDIVCAGKLGGFALEDAALAGWLCHALAARGATLAPGAARLAGALAPEDAGALRALVEGASHARELRGMGVEYVRDVEFCATLDLVDASPLV